MKKILILITVILISIFCFTGCACGCQYDHAYINMGDSWKSIEIADYEWYSKTIRLELKDGTIIRVSYENCILYKGTLPGVKK